VKETREEKEQIKTNAKTKNKKNRTRKTPTATD
jgi:hypothetical protein